MGVPQRLLSVEQVPCYAVLCCAGDTRSYDLVLTLVVRTIDRLASVALRLHRRSPCGRRAEQSLERRVRGLQGPRCRRPVAWVHRRGVRGGGARATRPGAGDQQPSRAGGASASHRAQDQYMTFFTVRFRD